MLAFSERDIEEIQSVAERNGVDELYLFGSAARGQIRAGSDLDFLVDFLPNRPDRLGDFCSLKEELGRITQKPIDLVIRSAIRNPYFKESVFADAQLVYASKV